jgi:GNAT superfamily N-acetyltransferase
MRLRRDGYELSDDPRQLDVDAIWSFLRGAYWSPNVPRDVVERSIAHSLCLGLYAPGGEQAGFARAVTDRATFAWIADVFVLEPHRGRGLGVWLVETLFEHPALSNVRGILLATADAHPLYERFGFGPLEDTERLMARRRPPAELYGSPAEKLTE